MNPYQPSANSHSVEQRLDDRRAAATNYRLAKATKPTSSIGRFASWRCAIGNRLISIGEGLATPKRPALPNG